MHIYIYIYSYIEREREREIISNGLPAAVGLQLARPRRAEVAGLRDDDVYIYIYIYI